MKQSADIVRGGIRSAWSVTAKLCPRHILPQSVIKRKSNE
jgi:hypothetical protein